MNVSHPRIASASGQTATQDSSPQFVIVVALIAAVFFPASKSHPGLRSVF